MKNLLILAVLITSISTVKASCNITLYKKTIDAKTSYTLDGDSVSKRVIEKLSPVCKFTVKAMSGDQKRAMTIKSLQKRLAKLNTKK